MQKHEQREDTEETDHRDVSDDSVPKGIHKPVYGRAAHRYIFVLPQLFQARPVNITTECGAHHLRICTERPSPNPATRNSIKKRQPI